MTPDASAADSSATVAPPPTFATGLEGLISELRWRGMFHAASDGLEARFASNQPMTAYNGFDPSGPWLHIGHLVPIFGLIHFQRRGGRPIALVGGGTGMIGDPSGRSSERNLQTREQIEVNVASIRPQLEHFLDFSGPRAATMANNADWLEPLSLLDFLRDTGKHFTIPYMLAKDSVQVRLEGGLSFTEFSYMLIQSYDFRHLFRELGCELQMGGADQWGNITAGLELIRRTSEQRPDGAPNAFALAYPLLLNPSGAKFGKSETGDSVWLHADGTSPYAFYQHWLQTDDRDVPTYLRWFTLFTPGEIAALETSMAERPELRDAQRALAVDLTTRVHGKALADEASSASELLFSTRVIDPSLYHDLFRIAGGFETTPALLAAGTAVVLAEAGLVGSNSAGRRLVQGGGVVINGQRVEDPVAPLALDLDWLDVRVGKRRRTIGRVKRT